MSELQFEENNFQYKSRTILGDPQVPKVIKFLLGNKIVKNEKQAQALLLAVVIISVLLAIYFFASAAAGPQAHVIYDNY